MSIGLCKGDMGDRGELAKYTEEDCKGQWVEFYGNH